jgi:SAM-dependent methyltransferase
MWYCPNCRHPVNFAAPNRPWPSGWSCDACGFAVLHQDGIPSLILAQEGEPSAFDPKLFDVLVKHEDLSFWFVNRTQLIVELIRWYFPAAQSIFEIGCGTGHVLLALKKGFPSTALAGSDLYLHGLTFARGRVGPGFTLVQMDACDIPAIEQFDVIGAFDVIEHIADDQRVLDQIYLALRPNGGAVIAVPQHPWLWSPADVDAHHRRRYRRGELEAKLIKAGFRIRYSTSFNAVLIPLMIASRMAAKLRARYSAKSEPLAEFSMPSWLNNVLTLLLKFEVYLTLAGVRWPLGGSRFVVAQRP